jgi:hypothetical protein
MFAYLLTGCGLLHFYFKYKNKYNFNNAVITSSNNKQTL